MSFVVEDGSGLPDATSYVDIAIADAYHELRGNAAWAALVEPDKERALVLATDYVETTRSFEDNGRPKNSDQALAWPRVGAVDSEGRLIDSDSVPKPIVDSVCYLSGFSMSGSLFGDGERQESKVKIKDIEIEYSDACNDSCYGFKTFGYVDGLLGRIGGVPNSSCGVTVWPL